MKVLAVIGRSVAQAGPATRRAVAAQLLCATYLQLIEWVPLFPWNDIRHGNHQELLDGILACLQLAIAIGFFFHKRWAMAIGLAGYGAWLGLQLDSWWRPYLFGGRTVGPNWYFARTYKFLPHMDHRPTPDAAHVVLQLCLLLVIITAVGAWREVTTKSGAGTAIGKS
jgi:hypothetical protein